MGEPGEHFGLRDRFDTASNRLRAPHIVVGLLSEPDALAATILHNTGLTDERIGDAFGLATDAPHIIATAADLTTLQFTEDGDDALRGTLRAALRLGHNFIGTEHLLLGVLLADGPAAATLTGLGLDTERAELAVRDEIARLQQRRQTG